MRRFTLAAQDDSVWLIPCLLALAFANPVITFLLLGSFWVSSLSLVGTFLAIGFIRQKAYFFPNGYVLLVNLLAVSSLMVHAEVAFRYGFSDYVIENLYTIRDGYYFNKANLISRLEDKEYAVTYKTNVQGFRIPEFTNAQDSLKTCDWLFLGDSFTQGAQVSFEELYTSQLYRQFPDKIIVNAGISGFGIADEYNYFIKEGRNLAPQKVFLQLCNFNDFMNVAENRSSWNDYLMQYSDLARFLLYNLRYKPPGELPLGRWTEPFYPSPEDNAKYNIFYKDSSPRKQTDLKAFTEYLSRLAKAVKASNAQLVIILIPTKEQTYYRYLNEVLTSFKIPIQAIDLYRPNTLVKHLADSLGIDLIDLLPAYRRWTENVFFDYDEHLSPQGHLATATSLQAFLRQADPGNRPVQLISQDLLGDRYPTFQGSQMTFQSSRDGTMELFMRELTTQQTHRLTFNKVDESHPMQSPEGGQLVFTEGDPAQFQTKVALMNVDGSQRHYVTDQPNEYGAIATFSPSGRYLVYAGWRYDSAQHKFTNPQIILFDRQTGAKRTLTNNQNENWRPVMSPQENFVLYISKRNGNFDLFQLQLQNGQERQLTRTPYDEWDPSLSKDGQQVVYAAHKAANWDLFEQSLPDGRTTQLTVTKGDEWDPVYSPNGTSVSYAGKFGLFQCIYRREKPALSSSSN